MKIANRSRLEKIMESEKELTIVAFGGLGGNFIERINQSRPEKTALVLVGAEDGAKTEAWDAILSPGEVGDAFDYARFFLLIGSLAGDTAPALLSLAKKAKERGAAVFVLAVAPFKFEGKTREAEKTLEALLASGASVLVFDNDKYATQAPRGSTLAGVFNNLASDMELCYNTLAPALATVGGIAIDRIDLVASLKGRVWHGESGGEKDAPERLIEAFAQIEERIKRAKKPAILLQIFSPEVPPVDKLYAAGREIESRLPDDARILLAIATKSDKIAGVIMASETTVNN